MESTSPKSKWDLTNVRRVAVGENGTRRNYQIGSQYRLPSGPCKLVHIQPSEISPEIIEIYLSDGSGANFKWKSIHQDSILEVEHNSNF